MSTTTPIPQPPSIPFLGNITSVDLEVPIRSFRLLAQQYGEIYQLNMYGNQVIHINSQKLVQEVSDDKKFVKVVRGALMEVRNLAGDGLFTSQTDEPNWGKAHRILMPAFGPAAVRTMFDDMRDICSQLLLKWDRFGVDHEFDPSHDFTCLAFDTIALCSMSHRLNSFYTSTSPPFTQNMVEVLSESNRRFLTPNVVKSVQNVISNRNDKYMKAIEYMQNFAQNIINKRKTHPIPANVKKDLLALMLEGEDPQTHEKLSEKNILYNLLTFLIAGHETTSGMLSFTTYYLLKNPSTLQKLREEVDSVTEGGVKPVTSEEIGKMPYLVAVMRESLRLSPTASARAVAAKEDTIIRGSNGAYLVKKDQTIVVHPSESQRDPLVWGEDADQFKPERMLDGKFEALPPHAWQPFGFGMRGCIGRAFAWQEILIVLSSIVQTFDLYMADPSYTLEVKQNLTIKPKSFKVRVERRLGRSPMIYSVPASVLSGNLKGVNAAGGAHELSGVVGVGEGASKKGDEGRVIHVYYGSNTGTCEGFAQRLVTDAVEHGFVADLATLDSAASRLPTDGPVLIVTASFEGEPADNATLFFSYLSNLSSSSNISPNSPPLKDVKFSIFGCGNKEWVRTYQRIPTLIDQMMEKYGAERLMERGEADASSSSFFQDFDEYETKLWGVLEKRFGSSKNISALQKESFDVQFIDTIERAAILRQKDLSIGKVIENRLLTKPPSPVKRHLEFKLPEGTIYTAGDYLAILPSNPLNTIKRALARFNLSPEQEIVINSSAPTTFPVNKPIAVEQLLKGYVELSQPATVRDLQILIAASKSKETQSEISALSKDYQESILSKRISVLDILEEKEDINISFASFLKMLPPMRIRQYSISSSPLVNAEHVTLSISVVDAPSLSGRDEQFLGVGSNYLANLHPGDQVQMVVRPSNAVFHLPMDPLVPVVMFSAGSGIAPFRAFIQERAAQKKSGRAVGKMLLFFGCRSPDQDYLYSETDLKSWIAQGVVDVRPAFSRKQEVSKGCKYVQDRIWHDRADITAFYDEGAKFFTCGSRKAANGVKDVCVKIIKSNNPDFTEDRAVAAFEKVQKERYATDIFD